MISYCYASQSNIAKDSITHALLDVRTTVLAAAHQHDRPPTTPPLPATNYTCTPPEIQCQLSSWVLYVEMMGHNGGFGCTSRRWWVSECAHEIQRFSFVDATAPLPLTRQQRIWWWMMNWWSMSMSITKICSDFPLEDRSLFWLTALNRKL